MKYLLDTCAVSDFLRGEMHTQQKIMQTSPKHIAVSAITYFEILYGLEHHKALQAKIGHVVNEFFGAVKILPFCQAEALIAGKHRAALRKQGQPIGAYDLLIAATALSHHLILISSNLREFKRLENLRIENWREEVLIQSP